MTASSNAWLLECDPELIVAVGDHEIVEYIQPPQVYVVPETPAYCNRVIAWQDRLVPVMDMAQLTGIRNLQQEASFVCLLCYQLAPGEALQYLALRINTTPQKVVVDDNQVCELANEGVSPLLKSVTLCSFTHMQQSIPILDLGKLCSDEFRASAQNAQDLTVQGFRAEEPVQVDSGHAQ